MVYCSRELLDISVTVANVGRALRFMDTFIKLLRVRGHNIIVKYNKTYAFLQGEEVEISFKERTKRVVVTDSRNWQSSEYHPTGILVFKMKVFYRETEWKDEKLPLESQLSKILAKMEIKANEHKLEQLEWKKERERQEEQERIKQARIARKEKELSDFK